MTDKIDHPFAALGFDVRDFLPDIRPSILSRGGCLCVHDGYRTRDGRPIACLVLRDVPGCRPLVHPDDPERRIAFVDDETGLEEVHKMNEALGVCYAEFTRIIEASRQNEMRLFHCPKTPVH